MQAWEDTLRPGRQTLQQLFIAGDVNADGVFTLADFRCMIHAERPDMPDGASFSLFDDCLHMSELMLGYESDAILLEAFICCALEHSLLREPQSSFRLTPPTALVFPQKRAHRASAGREVIVPSERPILGTATGPVTASLRNM